MSKLDILWRERQDEIFDEVEKIHEEKGRSGEPDTFGLRNTAASRVYARLSEDEKVMIERQVNSAGQESNPPELQRKCVPNDYGKSCD